MITTEQINLMKDVIVETMQPEKIYLFGSYATGDAREESDIDILIEVNKSTTRPYQRSVPLRRKFLNYNELMFDKDIFVYTTEEVKKYRKKKYSFLNMALSNSQLIYKS